MDVFKVCGKVSALEVFSAEGPDAQVHTQSRLLPQLLKWGDTQE